MKTTLTAGIAGVILFAISASASWYLMNQNPAPETVVAETDEETEAGVPPIGIGIKKQEQMPVAMRPDVPMSIEAVLKLSDSIRRKERELIAREKLVDRDNQNIKLLFEDLKVERAELTAIADSIDAKLRLAQDSLANLKLENQSLTTQTQALSKLKKQLDKVDQNGPTVLDDIGKRVDISKSWFEGLAEEQAASYLKEFANNGELEFAARMLKSMEPRKASKILAAFDDPAFAQQILNSLAPSESDSREDDDGETAHRAGGSSFR
jgi:hypothetical protein